jgi:hypothetical protein
MNLPSSIRIENPSLIRCAWHIRTSRSQLSTDPKERDCLYSSAADYAGEKGLLDDVIAVK